MCIMSKWNYDTPAHKLPSYPIQVFEEYRNTISESLYIKPEEVTFCRVDCYHNNVFFIKDLKANPLFVVKAINPASWDSSISMITREVEISNYSYRVLRDMKPRIPVLFKYNNDTSRGVIVYNYLGSAFTYEKNINIIDTLAKTVYSKLFSLHSNTLSPNAGFGSFSPMYNIQSNNPSDYSFRFLLKDIDREKLDSEKTITKLIVNKWTPLLNQDKIFTLTHADVTLSNIILSGKKIEDITLIDWTYSIWQNPCYDIANMFFWHYKYCGLDLAVKELRAYTKKYKKIGLDIVTGFPPFFARKLIDYGRFNDKILIKRASEILNLENFEDVVEYCRVNPLF